MKVSQYIFAAILTLGASVASAETIDVSDDHGGLLAAYQAQWAQLSTQGVNVRIVGPCVSACTVLLGYIPRQNICVTSGAYFGFHLATTTFATEDLLRAYPADIRVWLNQRGGLSYQLIWMQAPTTYRFFRRCTADGRTAAGATRMERPRRVRAAPVGRNHDHSARHVARAVAIVSPGTSRGHCDKGDWRA